MNQMRTSTEAITFLAHNSSSQPLLIYSRIFQRMHRFLQPTVDYVYEYSFAYLNCNGFLFKY